MKLAINKKYNKEFAYKYLPELIYKLIYNSGCNYTQINNRFNINSLYVFRIVLKTLIRSETTDEYILSINKNLKLYNMHLDNLIKLISYGNRETKGVPILLNVFSYIENNLEQIYARWLNGN